MWRVKPPARRETHTESAFNTRQHSVSISAQPFGIAQAPTRFGHVAFTMQAQRDGSVRGSFQLVRSRGAARSSPPLVALKIRSARAGAPLRGAVALVGDGVELVVSELPL